MSEIQSATVPAGAGCLSGLPSETLEQHCRLLEGELTVLRESEGRLRVQHSEWQRKERVLLRRLAAKEQEMQDLVNQISELKTNQTPGPAALRSALLDPAVNLILQKLKNELQTTKARLEETQNELSAWKFTPDSNTGKRLMAKCRLLYQENEELGKMTSNGRFAKLEGDLALQKSFSDEVKKSQSELDDFLQELDEDVEGMQSTIYYLQQELRSAKESVQVLEQENQSLRLQKDSTRLVNGDSNRKHSDSEDRTKHLSPKWSCNRRDSSDSEPELIIKVSEQEICEDDSQDDQRPEPESESNVCDKRTKHKISEQDRTKDITKNGIDTERTTKLIGKSLEFNKRNYESDSSDCSNERTNSCSKKARRSSVLSLDYNDDTEIDLDDALVISTNGDTNISDAE